MVALNTRLVEVTEPGKYKATLGRYFYDGQDRSQNVRVEFWLDKETGRATNTLIREHGTMQMVVRNEQMMGVWPIVGANP